MMYNVSYYCRAWTLMGRRRRRGDEGQKMALYAYEVNLQYTILNNVFFLFSRNLTSYWEFSLTH